MRVAAVVVSHGHPAELAESLPALEPQVDELVVIANIPGSVPDGVRLAFAERERYARAGLERAALFTWEESARRTADVYRQVLA